MRPVALALYLAAFSFGYLTGSEAGAPWLLRFWTTIERSTGAPEPASSADHLQSVEPGLVMRQALEAAEKETARYRRGLEKAVVELNKLAGECSGYSIPAPAPLPSAERSAPRPRRGQRRSSLRLEGPKLQPWGEDLVAFGQVVNRGGEDEVAAILLELYHDGELIEERQLDVFVGAGGEEAFEETFWTGKLDGKYQVRGRLLD